MKQKLFALLVASDQILKLLAVKFFHPALNSGVAFGIGENIPVIATIVVYLILFISIYKSGFKYGEMLLLAGGAGNILDRLIYGKIVDWIRFGNLWFNLADVYICLGTILIFSHIVIPAKAGIYINNYLNRFRVKRFDRHELTAEWHGMTTGKYI